MSDHTVYPLLSAESIKTAFNLKIKGEDPPSPQLIHFFKSDGNYLIKDFGIFFFLNSTVSVIVRRGGGRGLTRDLLKSTGPLQWWVVAQVMNF